MWTRPSLPSEEIDLFLTNGVPFFRVRVKRPEEVTWTNLFNTAGGDWALKLRAEIGTPDQPARVFNVSFLKKDGSDGLSPGIEAYPLNIDAALEFRPLIHPGRHIEIDVAITDPISDPQPVRGTGAWDTWYAALTWRLWQKGEIEDVDWPGNSVDALCMTLDKPLLDTMIEEVRELGGEIPIEDVFEQLIYRWYNQTAGFLRVIGDPAANLKNAKPEIGSLGEFLFSNAKRLAWDLRYLWSEADNAFKLTLYDPPRDKTTPDLELATTDVYEVAGLKSSRKYVRNALILNYEDRETTPATPYRFTETFIDQDSIDEYRRRAIILTEEQGSPIDGPTNAGIFGPKLISDLKLPLITARKRMPFLPWLELHDLLAFEEDGDHYDSDMAFAVVGGEFEVDSDSGCQAFVDLHEGAPVGQVINWIDRGEVPFVPPANQYSLIEFDFHDEDPLGRTYTWQNAVGTTEIWAATATHADPIPESALEALQNAVTPRGLITELLVPWPPMGYRTIGRVEVRYSTADGMAIGEVGKIDVPGLEIEPTLEITTESETSTTGTFGVTVRDDAEIATSLEYRTKSGPAAWSAWAVKTASPVDDTEYQHTIALVEGHLSFIEFRLNYTFQGASRSLHLASSGFDRGYEPNVVSCSAFLVGDRVWLSIGADSDTNTSGLSIVGTGHIGWFADNDDAPTISVYDFALSNARAGTVDTGLDTTDPGPGLDQLYEFWLAGVKPGGAAIGGPTLFQFIRYGT